MLGAEGNITVVAIILFILLVGVAFAVMDKSGILKSVISRIIKVFGGSKYTLFVNHLLLHAPGGILRDF